MGAIAIEEALPIDRTLVLGIGPPIDEIAHGDLPCAPDAAAWNIAGTGRGDCRGRRPRTGPVAVASDYCDLRTRRYHSESSRTCFSV
ncbi:hypothetical protein HPA02_31720 [Bisbaumannia pacifica]|uniref:Uncharacterized protein n=1 Tax=Bisbaumannia pacifica TaxID=77098 RepID=A0A510XBR3_9GAMM|nr:hypothetical protein HPA02_31720 [Halomonas pacifica]